MQENMQTGKLLDRIRKTLKITLAISLAVMAFSSCAGIDPKEIERWRGAGINDLSEVEIWKAFGFDSNEAVTWKKVDFDVVKAYWWKKSRFEPEEAKKWSKSNIPVGYEQDDLDDTGLRYQDIKEWIDTNVESFDQLKNSEKARKLVRSDHSLEEAIKSLFATQWKNAGLSAEETARWVESDFGGAIRALVEVVKWRRANFSPEEAKKWNYADINIEKALEWKRNKFTAEEAENWKTAGFISPGTATKWRTKGLNPEAAQNEEKREAKRQQEAKEREQNKRAQKIKSVCPNGVEEFPELIRSNPFDVKGRCFEFRGGKVLQILDRTSALFTFDLGHDMDRTWYLNFGNNSVPNVPFFRGYVKGEGVFEYTNVLGAKQVIPRLKVINLD